VKTGRGAKQDKRQAEQKDIANSTRKISDRAEQSPSMMSTGKILKSFKTNCGDSQKGNGKP